jgi:hypothetical protein
VSCPARPEAAERRIVWFARMMFIAGSRPDPPNHETQTRTVNPDPSFTNSSQNPHYNLTDSHQTDDPRLIQCDYDASCRRLIVLSSFLSS